MSDSLSFKVTTRVERLEFLTRDQPSIREASGEMLTATLDGSFLSYLENGNMTIITKYWKYLGKAKFGAKISPDPGGDGLVVVEDRSTASKVHRLTILIYHIVVHSEHETLVNFTTILRPILLMKVPHVVQPWLRLAQPVKHGEFAKTSHGDASHASRNLGKGNDLEMVLKSYPNECSFENSLSKKNIWRNAS